MTPVEDQAGHDELVCRQLVEVVTDYLAGALPAAQCRLVVQSHRSPPPPLALQPACAGFGEWSPSPASQGR